MVLCVEKGENLGWESGVRLGTHGSRRPVRSGMAVIVQANEWDWPGLRGVGAGEWAALRTGVADGVPGSGTQGPHAPWTLPPLPCHL